MKPTAGAIRRLLRYLESQDDKEAAELASLFASRKPPRKAPPAGGTTKQRKTAKRETRREKIGALRSAVLARAGGGEAHCELCGSYLENVATGFPLRFELHHLESGSGARRAKEDPSNCMAVHGACHREYHANPHAFADTVRIWAKEFGYPIPSRFR